MGLSRIGLAALLVGHLAGPGSAVAQDEGDWDFGEDRARDLSIAAVSFENFGVAVRCMAGSLSVVMSGLPTASGLRTIQYRMGDAPEMESKWVSGMDSNTAFAIWPRSVASGMSRGGRLSMGVPDGETVRRYAVDLPPSADAIARVFRACDHELSPPGEDAAPAGENFAGLVWRKSPEINFPDRARYETGMAAILCLVRRDGRLQDCTVESEFPEGSGFGRAATLGAHQSGQVAPADASDSGMEGRRISFLARYSTRDALLTPPPSRLPGRDEAYNPQPDPEDDE